jgi:hypothetical protein
LLYDENFETIIKVWILFQDFPDLAVVKMTQEIGFVEPRQNDEQIDFGKFPIGKPLFLYQYHSCDTAAKFPVS